jgi:hypothetical protein
MRRVSTRALLVAGLAVTLLLAGFVSFYASSHPDGLESVAEQVGFSQTAQEHASSGSPFADYGTQGVSNQRLSGGVAGVVGVLVVALLGGGLAWALRRRGPSDPETSSSTETEAGQSSVTR